MSWEPLGTSRENAAAPALVASTAGKGRLPPMLQVTLRLKQFSPQDFVKARGTCQVLFGRGPNAGRLRIVPGTSSTFFALGRLGSRSEILTLRVKMPEGITAARRSAEAAAMTQGEDWIELQLPGWCVAVERIAPPPPARASIMERVADPAAALRGPGARR